MNELVAKMIEREALLLARIDLLKAEVKAWRDTWHARHDTVPDVGLLQAREKAMRDTDAANALGEP